MKDNGKVKCEKEKEHKNGPMVQDMKGIGKQIKPMEKVNFTMLMEMYLKVNGNMIKQMGLVLMFM